MGGEGFEPFWFLTENFLCFTAIKKGFHIETLFKTIQR